MDREIDAVDLGGGDWLYTSMSEERIMVRCPDVRDCTVIAGRDSGGGIVTDVFLLLAPGAPEDADRAPAVREALGEPAAGTLRRVVVVRDEDIVTGPTGKVRKFLMRERHLAGTVSAAVPVVSTPDTGLHPQVLAIRDRLRRDQVPHLSTLSLEQARAADRAAAAAGTGEAEPVMEVREIEIPGPAGPLPARVYRPAAPGRCQSSSTSTAAAGAWARWTRATGSAG